MDQIRPIGPREGSIEAVFAAQRIARDGEREPREQEERQPPREKRPAPEVVAPESPDDHDGGDGSLIDVRV